MTRNPVQDGEDFSATYWSSIYNAHAAEAVITGCVPSKGSGDWDVDVTAGEALVQNSVVDVSAGTVTLSASATDDRVDIVTVDDSGTLAATEGTADATPEAPAIPSGEVLIATVLVEGGGGSLASAGSQIDDYRTVFSTPPMSRVDVTSTTVTLSRRASAWVDTAAAGGAVTVTLPADADVADGDRVEVGVEDATNNTDVTANAGQSILGTNPTLSSVGDVVTYEYKSDSSTWMVR